MRFDLSQALQVLESTPRTLRAMLEGLADDWTMASYGPETFSPFDVLGHLIEGEREDWIPRARLILTAGPDRPFNPFDHAARGQPGDGATIPERLATFERLRAANLQALRAINPTEEQLDLAGTHPALGRVTLRNLLATWVVHDIHHRAQICKSMAFQYRDEVGPWRAYINTLPRA